MTKERIIVGLAGLVVGLAIGFFVGRSMSTESGKGAYFCCDRQGNNCVLAGPSCDGTLKWCEKTATTPAGNTICEKWG